MLTLSTVIKYSEGPKPKSAPMNIEQGTQDVPRYRGPEPSKGFIQNIYNI